MASANSAWFGRCSQREERKARALPLVPATWMTLTAARASPRASLCRGVTTSGVKDSPSARVTACLAWRAYHRMNTRARTSTHTARLAKDAAASLPFGR